MANDRNPAKAYKLVPVQEKTERTIITTYYVDGRKLESVRVIRSVSARNAVKNAIDYMRMDYFTANVNGNIVVPRVAVVYDEEFGKDLCIIRKSVTGKITIDEEVDPMEYELKKFGTFKIRPDRIPKKN